MEDGHRQTSLARACRDVALTDDELWLRYFALGGTAMPAKLRRCVRGVEELDPVQYDTVVQALNERYMELGRGNRLPYAGDN
jgi:hypothetical protein